MKVRWFSYIILIFIFFGSTILAYILPSNNILQSISAFPAIGALFAALFQLFRDQAMFEKQIILQEQQQAHSLGVASHMANKAFDKHAEFCEKYMAEVHLTVGTLFREGPTEKALEHSGKLVNLKHQYSAWLTNKIMSELEPFESALRSIGAKKGLVTALTGTGDPARSKAVEEMYTVFKMVMDLDDVVITTQDEIDNITYKGIEDKLRSILGIEELTMIRQRRIKQALQADD